MQHVHYQNSENFGYSFHNKEVNFQTIETCLSEFIYDDKKIMSRFIVTNMISLYLYSVTQVIIIDWYCDLDARQFFFWYLKKRKNPQRISQYLPFLPS